MLDRVAVAAEQLQIVWVERYRWIVDVARRDLDFVVDDLRRRVDPFREADLAKAADLGEV